MAPLLVMCWSCDCARPCYFLVSMLVPYMYMYMHTYTYMYMHMYMLYSHLSLNPSQVNPCSKVVTTTCMLQPCDNLVITLAIELTVHVPHIMCTCIYMYLTLLLLYRLSRSAARRISRCPAHSWGCASVHTHCPGNNYYVHNTLQTCPYCYYYIVNSMRITSCEYMYSMPIHAHINLPWNLLAKYFSLLDISLTR